MKPIVISAYLMKIILGASVEYNLDPNLIISVIYVETRFRNVVSKTNDYGYMQIHGVDSSFLNPKKNIYYGTRKLKKLINKYKDTLKALAAYNLGETGFKRRGINAYAKKTYKLYLRLKSGRFALLWQKRKSK